MRYGRTKRAAQSQIANEFSLFRLALQLLKARQPNNSPSSLPKLRRNVMTRSQRIAAAVVGALMLFAGFGFGRLANHNQSADAPVAAQQLLNAASPNPAASTTLAAADNQTFYLRDFKTGYDEGYQSGLTNQAGNLIATERAGYNDGFKEGYADGVQQRGNSAQVSNSFVAVPAVHRARQSQVYYQPVRSRGKRRSSKVRTALTIAGPAAVGAGVGILAGGKKGAAVGALLGGGGGALYHLFKNRN
jgi:hypothetical protein